MNDFFLATNRSIKVPILDIDIEVRQIQMKDFDTWAMHAEVLKNFIKDKDHSDEILTEALAYSSSRAALRCLSWLLIYD